MGCPGGVQTSAHAKYELSAYYLNDRRTPVQQVMQQASSPDLLNLVLVDFKGGATFLGLDPLPHVAAVITNLADDLGLVDRMPQLKSFFIRQAAGLAGPAPRLLRGDPI